MCLVGTPLPEKRTWSTPGYDSGETAGSHGRTRLRLEGQSQRVPRIINFRWPDAICIVGQ